MKWPEKKECLPLYSHGEVFTGDEWNSAIDACSQVVKNRASVEYILSMCLVDYQIRFQDGSWFKKLLRNGKLVEVRADQELATALSKMILDGVDNA